MASDFTVRGSVDSPTQRRDEFAALYGSELRYQVRSAVNLAGVSRASGTPVALTGADDDIIEVEDVDGVITFQRAATLVAGARRSSRGGDADDLTAFLDQTTRGQGTRLAAVRRISLSLPPDIAADVATVDAAVGTDIAQAGALRDGLGMIAGRVPGVLLDRAAKDAMRRIADWIDTPAPDHAPAEERRRKAKVPGVYRIGPDILLEPGERLAGGAPAGADPYLVLLHGTFSHTEAAFGALRDTPEWASLAGRYQGRMLAIEHPTLGRTPAENARDAAALLPEGARLHLVSHSRGGLVGEALSYAAKHHPVLDAYAAVRDHPDVVALPELHRILSRRGITVERFARVACPARGTTLASRRLDEWASFLFNVFNVVPVLRETGVAALVKKFLLAMLEKRTDPRVVPGIEAQMPESAFLRMLLAAPALTDGLGSITGDVEGSGLTGRLKVLATDLFYREDHDYVVPTSSMSGGVRRAAARSAFFHGPKVSHSAYFDNADSRGALAAWLTAKPDESVPSFTVPATSARSRDAAPGTPAPVGEVLLVPDVFGTALTVDGQPAWPDVAQLVRLGLDRGLGTGDGHGVGALVEDYAPLSAALTARYIVTGSPYDPRRPLADAAAELAAALRARLDAGPAPVHLVTHGAGALVALGALRDDELLAKWRAAGGRAVLLSPPLEGTWLASAQLAGRDELAASLALLDHAATPVAVGELLARWPVLVELRPDDRTAAESRQALLPVTWDGIGAVYGTAQRTVCGVDTDGTFRTSPCGDGHVLHPAPQRSAAPGWFALAPHAELLSDPDVASAVLELLAGRVPTRLLTAPRSSTRTGAGRSETRLPDPRGEMLLPTPQELVRAAWGGRWTGERKPVLRVNVVHGHLRSVNLPIMVGHQDLTPLAGAEKELDRHLRGALERRMAVGLYPGPIGSCEVFGAPGGTAPMAVVLGLGNADDLTPGGLTAGVTQAVLRLAAAFLDRESPDAPPLRLAIASVLMGTALVPPMPVENSLSAVVSGVLQANRRLRDLRELGGRLVVEELQIVELYEERAIQAVRCAKRLPQDLHGADGDEIVVGSRLLDGCDGRSGLPRPDYHEGVWRTIRIVATDPTEPIRPEKPLVELSFTSIGRSARAEQRVNTGQRELIDALVAEAIGNPNPDDQLFNTLYELLVPTALKGQGYGSENVMLVVDEHAAVLPLEMLGTRSHEQTVRPLAVEVGVVRRLETRTFTELTRPSAGNAALVIGDPPGTGLPRLDAAREEARRVRDLLESWGYHVTAIIPDGDPDRADVVPILNALFRREYRIVHVAGHGDYSTDPSRSGVVIGRNTYLGALEIEKMRTTPDLVFLNCCHLAAMQPRPGHGPEGTVEPPRADRLAASVSRQLIDNGVRAVVAAGWAVDDEAAAVFATEFYDGLLGGGDLGAASQRARKAVYDSFQSTTNTWGAYQVYGPPAFRLDPARAGDRGTPSLVARRELADALTALRERAKNAPDSDSAGIATELEKLLAEGAQWLSGAERSLAGEVWELLARYQEAVDSYEMVQRDWGASASMKTLERLVNVRAKWAVERALHPTQPGPTAAELFTQADESVELLLKLGRTPERLSLRGSVARRRAQCLPPEQADALTTALTAARDAYHEAAELYRESTGVVDFYPALNEVVLGWLVAQRCGSEFDGTRAQGLTEQCRAAALARRCPDFWCRVTAADADLAAALISQQLPARVEALTARYLKAYAGSSRRERITVLEHLDIIERALPRAPDGSPGEVAEAVAALRSRLVSRASPG